MHSRWIGSAFWRKDAMISKSRILIALCIAASVAMVMIHPGLAAEHTKDSLETVKARLNDQSAVLVDVREQKEWDDGHIRDAQLIPLSKLKVDKQAEKLTKDLPKKKIVYCHCAAGVRALTAADILKKQGYDVRPLKAGYKDLLEAGFPKAGQ